MAFDIKGFARSYEAGADLSAKKYTFVKKSGALIIAAAAATDKVIGVLTNAPKSGEVGTVEITGVVKVVCADASIAAGVPVYITALGKVSATVQAGQCVGVTETATSNADEIVSVLLKPLGAVT